MRRRFLSGWSKIEEDEDDYVISRNFGLRPSEMEEADCT
jgi:hypothetical protein